MGIIHNATSNAPTILENGTVYDHSYFTNEDAVSNLIHFLMRPNSVEEILGYGCYGVADFMDVEVIIRQFLYVQERFHINSRRGKRMYHEIFSMEAHEVIGPDGYLDMQSLLEIGHECSSVYYEEGHQVIFVIHRNGTGYHIHFAVNSVSFVDGHKFRTNRVNRWERELIFNEILQRHRGQCHGTLREMKVQGDNPPSAEDVEAII